MWSTTFKASDTTRLHPAATPWFIVTHAWRQARSQGGGGTVGAVAPPPPQKNGKKEGGEERGKRIRPTKRSAPPKKKILATRLRDVTMRSLSIWLVCPLAGTDPGFWLGEGA